MAQIDTPPVAEGIGKRLAALRKERGLNIEDRIHPRYQAGGEPARAIEEWADYIRGETLALSLESDSGIDTQRGKAIQLAKEQVVFDLAKA